MNNYFTLRKANRLRTKLLTNKSQGQIREVVKYLRRVSWDVCGVELVYSDLLYPVVLSAVPDYRFEFSLGYMIQLCICMASSYYLFRRMMERIGFPPCAHRLKCAGYFAIYVAVIYGIGSILHQMFEQIILISIAAWPMTVGSLLFGVALLWFRYFWYGKDERLKERL